MCKMVECVEKKKKDKKKFLKIQQMENKVERYEEKDKKAGTYFFLNEYKRNNS